MHKGRLRGCGSISELRGLLGMTEHYELSVLDYDPLSSQNLSEKLSNFKFTRHEQGISQLEFEATGENGSLDDAVDAVRSSGGKIRSISREQASLEDIFDQLTDEEAPPIQTSPPNLLPGSHPSWKERKKQVPGEKKAFSFSTWALSFRQFLHIARAFIKRDFVEEISYRFSFFMQFFGMFFTVAMFFFISRLLGPAMNPYLEQYGGDYFSFALIGIAFSGYFGLGLTTFSNSLRQAQTTGTLEAMLTTPAGISTIILSSSLWSYVMTTLRVFIYLLMGFMLAGVKFNNSNYLAAVVILLLTVVSFSSIGIIAASFIMVIKRGDPVTWIFSATASLVGGIYYPISVLPKWLQFVSNFIPITYSLQAMRMALLQGASFAELLPQMGILALFCVALLPISLFSFRYALRQAKIDGSLTHY